MKTLYKTLTKLGIKMAIYRYNRGISELLALVLGLAITIAIGIAFYSFLPSFLNTSLQQQRVALSISSINMLSNNEISIVANIKNLGSKDIENFNITIESENIKNFNINVVSLRCSSECNYTIQPGQEVSLLIRASISGSSFKIGQKVIVSIIAKYVDGSIAVASATGTIY